MTNLLEPKTKVRIVKSPYLTIRDGAIGRVDSVLPSRGENGPLYRVETGALVRRTMSFYANEIEEIK